MASDPEASPTHAVRYPRASASWASEGNSAMGMARPVSAMSMGMGSILAAE